MHCGIVNVSMHIIKPTRVAEQKPSAERCHTGHDKSEK